MGLRLKIRYNIDINEEKVIKEVFKKKLSYKSIYDELMKEQLRINPSITICGEDSAMNWRFIEKFNKLYKKAKIIHIIRDPRSIFASWKKITYQKKDYWGCIVNCIDNMNYASHYKKHKKKNNYMAVKFEDVLLRPEFYAKKFSKFLNIDYEKQMVQPKKWNKIFKNKFASLGWSSIEKKSIDGFFLNRLDAWKTILTKKEIILIEYFLKKNLTEWSYELSGNKINKSYIKDFNKIINTSPYLKKIFKNFKMNRVGSDQLKNNPRDPKTWGDGKKNKKKFIESREGKLYLEKLSQINKTLEIKYK